MQPEQLWVGSRRDYSRLDQMSVYLSGKQDTHHVNTKNVILQCSFVFIFRELTVLGVSVCLFAAL